MIKERKIIGAVSALFQLTGWALFILVPLFSSSHEKHLPPGFYTEFLVRHFFLAVFFYLNFLWLIPSVLKRKGVRQYLLYIIPLCVSSFFVLLIIENFVAPRERFIFSFKHIVPLLQVYTVGTALRMISDFILENRRKRVLEQEKQQAELAFLRSQINPHFLFNTLNNINSLIEENPGAAQTAVVRLSGLMRFMLNSASSGRVSLQKEVEYLQGFISLQRLRLTDDFNFTFTADVQHPGAEIEPLLLIGFIENTFKHALSGKKNDFIEIRLREENKQIHLHTRNSMHEQKTSFVESGIGIRNSKKRLELLYPDRHQLHIHEEGGIFEVKLSIRL